MCPQLHSSSRVGAIIPEPGSGRLRAGSITNGLNLKYTSLRRRFLTAERSRRCGASQCAGPGRSVATRWYRSRKHSVASRRVDRAVSHRCFRPVRRPPPVACDEWQLESPRRPPASQPQSAPRERTARGYNGYLIASTLHRAVLVRLCAGPPQRCS